jgi:hypothetical protein
MAELLPFFKKKLSLPWVDFVVEAAMNSLNPLRWMLYGITYLSTLSRLFDQMVTSSLYWYRVRALTSILINFLIHSQSIKNFIFGEGNGDPLLGECFRVETWESGVSHDHEVDTMREVLIFCRGKNSMQFGCKSTYLFITIIFKVILTFLITVFITPLI